MTHALPNAPDRIPSWLVVLGSVAIVAHLGAVAVMTLAAPSGPWPTPDGMNMATPPLFAQSLNELAAPSYLRWLRMTHNYHFISDRPGLPGVTFEAHLKDQAGKELAVLQFPDEEANPWVRYRQGLLARQLADDQPLPPMQGEVVAAAGQQGRKVKFWAASAGRGLYLSELPQHLVPRDRPVFSPGEWSMLLARSYARYLGRTHGAAAVEIVRRTRDPISPAVLFMGEPPPGAFEDLVANFGELKGE